jgi:2-octaprenyl-6-methoxyphenol hydroxylase
MSEPNVDYDVLIVGGGMVGATLACSLGATELKVGIVEAYPFGAGDQPSYDDRSIALAYGSRVIIESMALWTELKSQVTAIRNIHISDRGRFGFTRLNSADYGVEALGYVVEMRVMGALLSNALSRLTNVDLLSPASVVGLTQQNDHVNIDIETQGEIRRLSARLVVAADGDKSFIRQLLNVPTDREDYGQTAVIANVTPGKPHDGVAYERFTDTGPLALLPLSDNRCSLVWTVRSDQTEEMLGLSDEEFLSRLQTRFGYRLGRFAHVGRRRAYPLALVRARQHVVDRVALIGNAAHTLHPVAGQGFNLGIRDVAALAQVIVDGARDGLDVGHASVLNQYVEWRTKDHQQVITFTDTLARLCANSSPPVVCVRNLGLVALDLAPSIKRMLARRTMGLTGKQPRLARQLSL